MELSQLIKERRSVQLYEDREVPVEELKEMLEAAIWVPNHKMTEPWRFIFVHGESRKKIAEINRKIGSVGNSLKEKTENGEKAYQKIMDVPVLLMVVMEENPSLKLREEDYASTSCVIHNFSLLAWEKGIGMIWKTNALTIHPEIRETIGVGPGERIIGMLQIGYPSRIPKARPRVSAKDRIEELS